MPRSARFFLSRVLKGGSLETAGILAALRSAVPIESRAFAWTVVDVTEGAVTHRGVSHPFLTGKLVKYDPEALVEVVDEDTRRTRLQEEPNLQRAASLFAFLPEEADFGHRHIWNEIRPLDFRTQMAELIVNFHSGFFVECSLQPIADLQRFLTRLAELETVTELKARVSPPNPLFGDLWRELKEYLDRRRLRNLAIKETARQGSTVASSAPELARRTGNPREPTPAPAPIGDAAVLMAADGYGTAQVSGRSGSDVRVIKTSESAVQLILDTETTGPELAAAIVREVLRMNAERGLRHP